MKKIPAVAAFAASVAISLLAAGYRLSDSAHSIGLMSREGGRVQHAAHFEGDKDRYVLIATATVLPPYRGDVRVSLEGAPGMSYALYNSGPAVDLGLRRQPVLEGDILRDVQPKDRLALWAVFRPKESNDSGPDLPEIADYEPQTGESCCPLPEVLPPAGSAHKPAPANNHQTSLAFYDAKTGSQVMRIPISFDSKDTNAE